MTDSTKLVSLIVSIIVGILVAVMGIMILLMYRKDQALIFDLVNRGVISRDDADKFTNSTWMWVFCIVLIIIGILVFAYGIFQYFSGVEKTKEFAKEQYSKYLASRRPPLLSQE